MLRAGGVDVTEADILNTQLADQDLLDDSVWERIRRDLLAGVYTAVFASPPCRTFCEARAISPGPPQLRDKQHPYGFPRSQAVQRGLSHSHYQTLREDNLLAARTAEACSIIKQRGGIYGVEQPFPWKDGVCMFDLDCFKELVMDGGRVVVFDQCMYEAPSTKPTQILYYGADFGKLEARCDHPFVEQVSHTGRKYQAPHPPVIQKRVGGGNYATNALAAYPYRLNVHLANVLLEAVRVVSTSRHSGESVSQLPSQPSSAS